jgi:hypothetical protein
MLTRLLRWLFAPRPIHVRPATYGLAAAITATKPTRT